MSTAFATLAENRVTHAKLHVSAIGRWWFDATVDGDVELSGPVLAELSDVTLTGAIVSGGPFKGTSRFRMVAGRGGWSNRIARKDYSNDLGVKRRTVLFDAATAAGEELDLETVPNDTVGTKWTRPAGPAASVLQLLAPEGWYLGFDGITRLGKRPAATYAGGATLQNKDLATGTLELASEQIADLIPGVVIEGIEAVDVMHELEPKGLRTMLWGAGLGSSSRRLDAWRALLEQLLPDLKYRGVTEYRIVDQTGERFDLQPVRIGSGMPDLSHVKARPGVAGARATVELGSTCLVAFVDASPNGAVILSFEDAEGEGFAPSRLDLVGVDDLAAIDATGRVVRYGDPIVFGPAGSQGVVEAGVPVGPFGLSRVRA